tara:strand:- start:267 stop:539 length:273 start_codon:yes stop_codon:yes gene_type:complete
MINILKNKITELMHGIKKRILSTVKAISDKGIKSPLARVHPGYVLSVLCPLAQNKNDAVTLIPLGKNTSRKERLNKIVSGLKKQGWKLEN